MKKLLFILMLVPYMSYSQCACACYDPNDVTDCTESSCSQSIENNCINSGLIWFHGSVNVPAGICACEYLQIVDLPVDLIYFNGDCERLYWETASESDCSHFTIEYSTDGKYWQMVGDVMCNNSQYGGSYSLELEVGKKTITYYRLTQYDFNGDNVLYPAISIQCDMLIDEIAVYDLLGRYIGKSIPENTNGIVIIKSLNGSISRRYLNPLY